MLPGPKAVLGHLETSLLQMTMSINNVPNLLSVQSLHGHTPSSPGDMLMMAISFLEKTNE